MRLLRKVTGGRRLRPVHARRDTGFSGAIGREMLRGIEDALWLSAWSNAMEEAGRGRELPNNITRESADPMPRSVARLARKFASLLVKLNRKSLTQIYEEASRRQGGEIDAEELGYYLTMQGLGHGVSWTDRHKPFSVTIPRGETYASPARGGRWSFDGWVSDRALTKIKGPKPDTAAIRLAQEAARNARMMEHEASKGSMFEHAALTSQDVVLWQRALEAHQVAADAYEEAGDLEEGEEIRSHIRRSRYELDERFAESQRDPSRKRRRR